MSVKLPNGATVSIASAYAASKAISAITNAASAVATLPDGHGVVVGDIVEISSGWSKLSGRIARVKAVVIDDVTLEGINTSNLEHFPTGAGTGSLRVISSWTQITQILEFASAGGDQQFATYSFLEDDDERQIPTVKGASSFTLSLGDDQTLPWFDVISAADDDREPRAIRIQLPSKASILYNTYATLNKTPSLVKNSVMAVKASFSLVAAVTRYATTT
ncbi:phage tail protein [Collimonas sp. NPDC087041]|uniref:phage tail protein n=1 Tax=Collimonas sp. NPDC087041 TaxID=3363960 RepID=UPI00380284ED